MVSIVERHLAEARQTLAQHDVQRHIIQNEVHALESVLRMADAGKANGSGDPTANGVGHAEDQEPRPHQSANAPHPAHPGGESFRIPYGSKRYRIEAAIEQFLRDSGVPQHRIQIMEHLKRQGIVGHEQNPLSVVSNALSNSKRFDTAGNGMWELVERM